MTGRPAPGPARRYWLARAAFACALAAVGVLVGFAGARSIVLVAVAIAGVIVTVIGLWVAVSHRGVVRYLGLALALAAVVTVAVLEIRESLLWVVLVALALAGLSYAAARAALQPEPDAGRPPEYPALVARRPYVVMNPRSGGGKVGKYGLREKAERLGATVTLLEGPGTVDVAALARQAVADGADLLGVAGGDGTQALVAGVAAEADVPLLVISAGTRNHFALDLGLDREDPSHCLDALTDGVELRVDLGEVAGRPFVNNASFGAYAAVVESDGYRDDKVGTTLDILPDLLTGRQGPHLVAKAGSVTIDAPQAVLVSNNPYGTGDIAGLGRRAHLDGGVLGVVGVKVGSAMDAARLLQGRRSGQLTKVTAAEVVVDADAPNIAVGVDGETLSLPTPVRCTVHPGVLRVLVPRQRPGVPAAAPAMQPRLLAELARPHRPGTGDGGT